MRHIKVNLFLYYTILEKSIECAKTTLENIVTLQRIFPECAFQESLFLLLEVSLLGRGTSSVSEVSFPRCNACRPLRSGELTLASITLVSISSATRGKVGTETSLSMGKLWGSGPTSGLEGPTGGVSEISRGSIILTLSDLEF
jgi:hypothetical protein